LAFYETLIPNFKIQSMKKSLLLIVCAVAIATTSQAQVRFGFKGGANLANVNGDLGGTKQKVGYYAGAQAKVSVSDAFSIQPELVYSNQGTKLEQDVTINFHLNYLNLPVMFQYNTPFGIYAETGPQISYLIGAKAKGEGQSEDVKEMFKSIDYGWGIGLGYQMQGSGLGLSARYNIGLAKINDSDGDEKITNGVIQIGFHYFLGGRPEKD
jgi:hypothetical protein